MSDEADALLRYELAQHRRSEREEHMDRLRGGDSTNLIMTLRRKVGPGGGEKIHRGFMGLMKHHYRLGFDDGLLEGAQRLKEWLMSKHPEIEALEIAPIVLDPDQSPGDILQMIRSAEHELRVAIYDGNTLRMRAQHRRIGQLLDDLKVSRAKR